MADPVLGTDVIIQFLHNDYYTNYGCATNIEIQFDMETKGVKTVGDGIWRRKRGQTVGAVINLSGVIAINSSVPTVFNLLAYFKQMTDVQYRIKFTDDIGQVQVIDGDALPTMVKMAGGTDGFATGDITLECNGDPDYVSPVIPPPGPDPDDPTICLAEIETATIIVAPFNRKFRIDSMTVDSPVITRWDYSVDGGGVLTAFTDGTIPATFTFSVGFLALGTHTITVTPICENGFGGTPYTDNFNI